MVGSTVNRNEGRIQAARPTTLAGIRRHDTHLDVDLAGHTGNAALHKRRTNGLKANGFGGAEVGITPLLLTPCKKGGCAEK